jgi:hypothetical protein
VQVITLPDEAARNLAGTKLRRSATSVRVMRDQDGGLANTWRLIVTYLGPRSGARPLPTVRFTSSSPTLSGVDDALDGLRNCERQSDSLVRAIAKWYKSFPTLVVCKGSSIDI